VVQEDDTKTGDKDTSTEIASIMSEINTADTQLNIPYSTKELKTHHYSDPNTIAEPFNRLYSLSITLFEDQERRIIYINDHNRRISANVGSVSATATISFAPE